jgi:hypothetical protein
MRRLSQSGDGIEKREDNCSLVKLLIMEKIIINRGWYWQYRR